MSSKKAAETSAIQIDIVFLPLSPSLKINFLCAKIVQIEQKHQIFEIILPV